MNFTEFIGEPQNLIGKYVLHTQGSINSPHRRITRIVLANKSHFQIGGSDQKFRTATGQSAKKRTRMDMGSTNYCELLTYTEALAMQNNWKENALCVKMRNVIAQNLKTASKEQLIAVISLLILEKALDEVLNTKPNG